MFLMIFCDSRGLGYCSEIRCTGKPMLVWLLRVCWQHSNSSYQSHQCQQQAELAFFQPTGQPRLGGEMEMVATMDWEFCSLDQQFLMLVLLFQTPFILFRI